MIFTVVRSLLCVEYSPITQNEALRSPMTCPIPHRLPLITSFSWSGTGPGNFYKHPWRVLRHWLERHCHRLQAHGGQASVCLVKDYLWGLTWARDITGTESILVEGIKECCSLQSILLGVLGAPAQFPGSIKSSSLELVPWQLWSHCHKQFPLASWFWSWNPALFPDLLCSLPVSLDPRPSLDLVSTFLSNHASISNKSLAARQAFLVLLAGPPFWVHHPATYTLSSAPGALRIRLHLSDWVSRCLLSL